MRAGATSCGDSADEHADDGDVAFRVNFVDGCSGVAPYRAGAIFGGLGEAGGAIGGVLRVFACGSLVQVEHFEAADHFAACR
jgi:hypothetical protein